MPRIPWGWVLIGTVGIATLAGGYWFKERERARVLREQILRVHGQELAEPARRYREFRDRIENWILRAAWSQPREHIDPRLRIEGLRAATGLYLRLYARDAKTKRGIDEGARSMDADTIASCLGLAPTSARGLWEKGEFLTAGWATGVRKEQSVMRLRVIDEMLARGIRSDLPSLLALTRSPWFMLVLQQGDTRRDHPVDVFLWDVRRDELLLRSRVQARGLLVPMRIAVGGAPSGPRAPESLTSGAATDCSIASQLKALAGSPEAEMTAPPAANAAPVQGEVLPPGAAPAGTAPGSAPAGGGALPSAPPPSTGAGASEPPKSP
jgi:hypothetical protein